MSTDDKILVSVMAVMLAAAFISMVVRLWIVEEKVKRIEKAIANEAHNARGRSRADVEKREETES